MAYNHKAELSKPERFVGGHRLCAGCGAGIVCRAMTRALDEGDRAVICNATGCLEVSSFLYPYTAWEDSYIHSAFENASATCGGVEAAYKALKRKGKIDGSYKFLTIGGDGGTYDIGFQSLSGAMERGHDMAYFCYDNEAYMNTGIQRSSSTPRLVFYPLAILWMECVVKYWCFGHLGDRGLGYTLLFSIPAGLFCALFCSLGEWRLNRRIATILMSLLAAWYMIQTVYYTVFKTFLVLDTLTMAGDALGDFWREALAGIAAASPALFLLLIPVIAVRLCTWHPGKHGRRE